MAKFFADAFAREGLEVWWDATIRSGETYDEVTEAALRGAKAVVVLWSPRSVASHWVRAEATIAHRAKTLFPVTIEKCDKPVMFELTQTADLCNWRGEVGDPAWQAFLADVWRMVEPDSFQITKNPPPMTGNSGPSYVAMLPISYRGGDEGIDILADDLTEEIVRELTNNGFFRMIAPGTMGLWRQQTVDYRAIGRDSGARYVVDGRLQQTGDNLRLTLQIVDAESKGMLKSERFSGGRAEIDDTPERFAGSVASALGELIVQLESQRAILYSGPLSGWQHMLRAVSYEGMAGPDTTPKWIDEARRAVEKEPELGLAHAQFAYALAVPAGGHGVEPNDAQLQEIRTHARRAMQLDNNNSAVIVRLISAYAAIGDGHAILHLAERAAQLNPNSASSALWLAIALTGEGRTADGITAIADYDRLSRFDKMRPLSFYVLGLCLFVEQRLAEAAAAFDETLVLNPEFLNGIKWKGITAACRGDETTAIAAIERLREIYPDMTLEQHVWQMIRVRKLGERLDGAVATLRRLWAATEGTD